MIGNAAPKVRAWARRLRPSSGFVRSVSVLASGTAAAQVIVVLASPLLTRLYTPDDFGVLAVFTAVLGLLSVVASLRYQLAIPLPDSEDDALAVAALGLLIVLGMALSSALVVALMGERIAFWFNTPALAPYVWLVPVGLFLTGVYQVLKYWAIRAEAYPLIARTRLTQATGMVGVQILGHGLGPVALLLGRVVGQSAGILSLTRSAFAPRLRRVALLRPAQLGAVGRHFRKFPLLSTWTGLSSSAGVNLPPLLIAMLLGAAPAGIYALTHRVLSQPMTVIGKAVGDVFYRRAVGAYAQGDLGRTVETVYATLVALCLPPAVTVFLVAPTAFEWIFGADWAVAGEVARWMMPWLFCQLVVGPSTRLYPILNKHGIALRFQLGFMFSGIVCVWVGGAVLDSLILAVVLLSTVNAAIYLARIAATYALVGLKPSRSLWILTKSFPAAIGCNLPLLGLWIIEEDIQFLSVHSASALAVTLIAVTALVLARAKRAVRLGFDGS